MFIPFDWFDASDDILLKRLVGIAPGCLSQGVQKTNESPYSCPFLLNETCKTLPNGQTDGRKQEKAFYYGHRLPLSDDTVLVNYAPVTARTNRQRRQVQYRRSVAKTASKETIKEFLPCSHG